MIPKLWAWAEATTGGRILRDGVPGAPPCFEQPVGWDGSAIHLVAGVGNEDEQVLHEACHWLVTPPERRRALNWGLGPGPRLVDVVTADNEEVVAGLLTARLARTFGVPPAAIPRPDASVTHARHVDWDACEARADALASGATRDRP